MRLEENDLLFLLSLFIIRKVLLTYPKLMNLFPGKKNHYIIYSFYEWVYKCNNKIFISIWFNNILLTITTYYWKIIKYCYLKKIFILFYFSFESTDYWVSLRKLVWRRSRCCISLYYFKFVLNQFFRHKIRKANKNPESKRLNNFSTVLGHAYIFYVDCDLGIKASRTAQNRFYRKSKQ